MNVFVNTQKHIQTRAIVVHVCDFISKFRWYFGEVLRNLTLTFGILKQSSQTIFEI